MLVLDEAYRTFFELVAAALASSLETARAFEEEKRRAESLAELDRAKTTFFNNVSHEFRTPLTLLLGPLDELRASASLPDGTAEQLEVMRRNALRLQRLVNALLEFSRARGRTGQRLFRAHGPGAAHRATSPAASAPRSSGRASRSRSTRRALDEPVFVDREMWERIVLNLLSNALKFTFEGTVTVALRAEAGEAVLTVQDTGTGIPEHELPHVFERFRRVAGARARTQEGSGIGLALVSDLVKLHGGRIGARSQPGEGSVFEVRLPLGSAHLDPGRIATDGSDAELRQADAYVQEALRWIPRRRVPGSRGRRGAWPSCPRVLVADDNADMRDYLSACSRGATKWRWWATARRPSRPPVAVGRTWS